MRIELPFFDALPVAVLGLGRSGLAAARILRERTDISDAAKDAILDGNPRRLYAL